MSATYLTLETFTGQDPSKCLADACGTMRTAIREVLTDRGFVVGHPQAEALVEKLLWKLHDDSIAWALREIIDRPESRRR